MSKYQNNSESLRKNHERWNDIRSIGQRNPTQRKSNSNPNFKIIVFCKHVFYFQFSLETGNVFVFIVQL